MRNSAYIRFSITLLLLVSLFAPVASVAANLDDGKKFFKEGMKFEASEEWDKAVEQFAMAVLKSPKNPEYRLHLTRALFNASQMFMKKGANQANERDYAGAYTSFRKAYGYDPTNELAKSEMERVVRLQKDVLNGTGTTAQNNNSNVRLVPTTYSPQNLPANFRVPIKMEEVRDFSYNEESLQKLIGFMAAEIDLNVLYDSTLASSLKTRKITIDLRKVTIPKALDYVFLQENLFFQRVGPRTILVADQNRRPFYQQLVLRTFYLSNANPAEVSKIVQAAIPGQQGRTTQTAPLIDEATNSITVRDTTENIKIIESLIKALDKDRAEVVMDVQIYEVSKSDLLKLGNQIGSGVGTANQLNDLGGVSSGGAIPFTGNFAANLATAIASGFLVPSVTLSAFQSKNNTKLIASTQIHAYNNKESTAQIGQRIPIRTATFQTGTTSSPTNGVVSDVINYEQVGLKLKFKPIVFPNQDVQVEMEIESKDVIDENTLTPRFTERTIKGIARVQNNKTLLLASVAQGIESNGRQGLPLLGLIPILGRLFSTPSKSNRTVDVVIAITPKVIRAPAILPEDEIERPTGSQVQPTNSSLEAMLIQEEIDEQLALERRNQQNQTTVSVQLPDRNTEVPTYVTTNPTTTASTNTTTATTETTNNNQTTTAQTNTTNTTQTNQSPVSTAIQNNIVPIDSSVRTLEINPTADTTVSTQTTQETSNRNAPLAELQILPTLSVMKKGEKVKLAILVRSATAFRSVVLGLKFDKEKLAVRAVSFGDVFGKDLAQTPATPFMNENGKMFVSLSSPKDSAENSSGILAYIEIEALADGKPQIAFEGDILNLLTADGKNFTVKF